MSKENNEIKGKAIGGVARANSLSKEQRIEIAKKGAAARWKDKPLKAIKKGNFLNEFGIDAECYVLNDQDKTAVVTKSGLAKLMSLGEKSSRIDEILSVQYMRNHVDRNLMEKLENPLIFQWQDLNRMSSKLSVFAHGFDITMIIDICKAILSARDNGDLPKNRMEAAKQAQKLINASAKTGIKNLAYAIAGYQPEVQEFIEAFKQFVREEARGYEKEFPEELYDAWYRIYQLNKPEGRGRPFIFRKLTNEQIYIPLAKSQGKILELAKNNKIENGKKNDKIHQFLSDVGVKALKQHIGKVLGVAALCDNKDEFEKALFGKLFKH